MLLRSLCCFFSSGFQSLGLLFGLALFGGKAVADARLQLIAARYGEAGSGGGGGIDWTRFGGSATTLYFDDHSDAKGMEDETPLFRTRLLDAMDLIDVGQHDAADAP